MGKLWLSVTRGGETRRYEVPPGQPQRVGRGQEAEILVSDISISRHQFTILGLPDGDGADLTVSPQSRNVVLVNGHPQAAGATLRLRPGDRLAVGYCAFELQVEAEVPVAKAAVIPPDPAGPIDASLAEDDEQRRIAPRWMAEEADAEARKKAEEAAKKAQKKPKTAFEKALTPAASLILLVMMGYFFLWPSLRPQEQLDPPEKLDLFADAPPVECDDQEQCYERARRAYEYGVKLAEQSGTSLDNLYKASRQFQVATVALRGQNFRLPELQPRFDTVRKRIITLFDDAGLRLRRAQQDNNPAAALAAIEEMLIFLQDSKSPYRDRLLRARVRVIELKEQRRRDNLMKPGRF